MLSQDEIDALLNQGDSDSGESNENLEVDVDDYLTSIEIDAIGEIGNISFGSASTAFSALLDQKVDITTPMVYAIRKKYLAQKFPQPHITINVSYTSGFHGTNLFVLDVKDARIISDLMMGGNGENVSEDEDLSEMETSAVQEAMNQMMGSAATSMSTIFNTVVNISTPSLNVKSIYSGENINQLVEEDIIILISFKMKIGNLIDSNFVQLLTIPFAKEMIETLMNSSNKNEVQAGETKSQVSNRKSENLDLMDDVMIDSKLMEEVVTSMNNNNSNKVPENNVTGKNVNSNIDVQTAQFSEFDLNKDVRNSKDANLGLLLDIPLQISVELGRTNKIIKDILELSSGSIVELDKLAGEPVDVYANRKLIAKGEVVVIDENFGVRITDIISQMDRVKKLQ